MIIGKGVGVILISKDRFVLLQHRDKRNKWNQDSWSEFGGQIEEGETPEEAAKRELEEELGIKIANSIFFKKYNLKRKRGTYIQFVFTASLNYPIGKLKKTSEGRRRFSIFYSRRNRKFKNS